MNVAYNIDCMEFMRKMPDNAFSLAVVDPPYGIMESGAKNHTRGKLAKARDYKPFYGGDEKAPTKEYFESLNGFPETKSFLVQTILPIICRVLNLIAGLYGTK